MQDSKQLRPLVVFGPSGSGKTSIVAMVAARVKEWLGDGAVSVFRFLGTSPESSGIVATLASLCKQLCEVFGIAVPDNDVLEDYSQVGGIGKRCYTLVYIAECDYAIIHAVSNCITLVYSVYFVI